MTKRISLLLAGAQTREQSLYTVLWCSQLYRFYMTIVLA